MNSGVTVPIRSREAPTESLETTGQRIWLATSLPAYMYFNPVVSLALGTHAGHANDWAMGGAWFNFRIDDRRIFSKQRVFTSATN
jgi:hypothetical protein